MPCYDPDVTICEPRSKLTRLGRASLGLLGFALFACFPALAQPVAAVPGAGNSAPGLSVPARSPLSADARGETTGEASSSIRPQAWPVAEVYMGGVFAMALTAEDPAALARRLAEVRARWRAAVTRDGTFRNPGKASWAPTGREIMVRIEGLPLVTVTWEDARHAGRSAMAEAEAVASRLLGICSGIPLGTAWDASWFRVLDRDGNAWSPGLLDAAIYDLGEQVPLAFPGVRASLHGGILRLSGEVDTLEDKVAVARDARNMAGVRDIENLVRVRSGAPSASPPPEAVWLDGVASGSASVHDGAEVPQ